MCCICRLEPMESPALRFLVSLYTIIYKQHNQELKWPLELAMYTFFANTHTHTQHMWFASIAERNESIKLQAKQLFGFCVAICNMSLKLHILLLTRPFPSRLRSLNPWYELRPGNRSSSPIFQRTKKRTSSWKSTVGANFKIRDELLR